MERSTVAAPSAAARAASRPESRTAGFGPPDDLDLLPRERARDAEAERLPDRLLAGEPARVALRRVRPGVAVRALGLGEAPLAKALVPRERAADPLDLDQVGADADGRQT